MTTITLDSALPAGTYSLSLVGASPPSPSPTPVPVAPPAAPPVVGCGPGEAYGASGQDRALNPLEQALWPAGQRDLAASGDLGTAIQFVADAGKYPLGILIHTVDETQPPMSTQMVVSACPHNFSNPINRFANYAFGGAGTIVLRFGNGGSVTDLNGDVPCPGGIYYINFREWKAPGDTSSRGTVYTQMWWQHRTDP